MNYITTNILLDCLNFVSFCLIVIMFRYKNHIFLRRPPNHLKMKRLRKNLFAILLINSALLCAQEAVKEPFLDDFKGTATVTNNGISLIPSFSLGDPALLFDLKFTKGRLSFEPDMRFALEGKPWTMVFWFRYKAIEKEKFSLRIGAHPALNYRTVSVLRNGQPENIIESRRYLAAEVAPTYKITNNTGIGLYYLHGRGFDEGVKKSHFFVLNSYFNNLYISKQIYFNISPQTYYLRLDDSEGYYLVGFITLAKKISRFPFPPY